ncbi:PAS domain-containing sensor histidine kinase [Lottiidibacillus patelloidae]|uniref:histidine kinase n=1 Tax=Lottiidibacillus patelloidae TaxID=2670334 RepID=A0A263BTX0_9BACI|nr:ATP-binding protein [Lottiidibacillus patelloidae]OZM57160.1 PAS domain-containing sensor histidine kinase [Lottiidibacillus patelloidae]
MSFLRSVVGKLWGTIIILVALVLFILTLLLLQYFENFHVNEAEKTLTQVATKISHMLEDYELEEEALTIASEILDSHLANGVIIKDSSMMWLAEGMEDAKQNEAAFFNLIEANKVLSGSQVIKQEKRQSEETIGDLFIVGVPYTIKSGNIGAVYVFQSIEDVEETTAHTKTAIFISATIAIILTTIFAFFLSSRITAPLRKMREAATKVAKGQFDTKVPMVTNDEIGELAMAFNRMGRQLSNNIMALNQEKEQLSSILSSMADGVITINKRGGIVITNPPAEQFLRVWSYQQGLNEEEKELPADVRELFTRVVSIEKEQFADIHIQGRSWVVVMTPLYNNNTIRGAVAVIRDMTEERRLDKLREDFIANVSHELRTPIAMLQGYSEAIIDDIAQSPDDKKQIAKIIYDESLRMGRLVNELLDLARMESEDVTLQLEEVELNSFIERVTRKFNGMVNEKNIALAFNKISSEKLTIDQDRIEQVLTNLIDNAIRHTPENGKVEVKVKSVSSGVQFSVSDNGIGIKGEELPYIFERFYKTDKARTRGRSGIGLGLAIAKKIVEAHKGQISVESKIGHGTTFSFYIPRIS